jgi:hypothetical protein
MISTERFQFMLDGYESEQAELKIRRNDLENLIEEETKQTTETDKFLKLVHSYTAVTELTPEIAREFIEKIIVGQPIYTGKTKRWDKEQEIQIIYNYIGASPKTENKYRAVTIAHQCFAIAGEKCPAIADGVVRPATMSDTQREPKRALYTHSRTARQRAVKYCERNIQNGISSNSWFNLK